MTVCADWLTGDDVMTCCEVEDATSGDIFDAAAATAQELLFEFSGRRFTGECEDTVRPCRTACGCGWQVLSRGHVVSNPNNDGSWWCDDSPCGCRPLSRTLLSGYVTGVTEVKIDGVIIDTETYRVDNHRWLVRVRQTVDDDVARWPGCQNLDLPDTEPGTWSVTYNYGVAPPQVGVDAAIELACEIYKACANLDGCRLPKGVVRLARQGVVMEKTPFASWGFESGKRGVLGKGWTTGMSMVDAFLNAYNPAGLTRAPVFWSPASVGRFAQRVG